METRTSRVQQIMSARGNVSYQVELWHDGLKKHRIIKSPECDVLVRKMQLQVIDWNEKWFEAESKNREKRDKEQSKQQILDNKAEAMSRTQSAEQAIEEVNRILEHTLSVNDAIDWERLLNKEAFSQPEPKPRQPPEIPKRVRRPDQPEHMDEKYRPRLGLLDRLFSSRKAALEEACRDHFANDHRNWMDAIRKADALEVAQEQQYKAACEEQETEFRNFHAEWSAKNFEFLEAQRKSNDAIERQKARYMAKDVDAITEYCDMVLTASNYPDFISKEFTISFCDTTKTLVVDYSLPAPDDLPKIKAVKYVASKDAFEESSFPQGQTNALYDSCLYQIALRTIHELFEADTIEALEYIVFNGFVTAIDKRNGQMVTACVLSLRTARNEFLAIDLSRVDPKDCFKALKGVGSSKLHGLAAVAPIMQISMEDKRFVSSQEVVDSLDETTNLATIDWEDFEHLVREVFEQEFTSTGGTVKITRASRDGGVDAIAFDPDPIRGGKIVIQAKRYNNTVGVAAVRDLYGTVINEGATKGILVTTSDYGPDSYDFAQGKPISLLNGANLLHLLDKHGHRARIELNTNK